MVQPVPAFDGIMDVEFYCKSLADHLAPYIQSVYPHNHRFMIPNILLTKRRFSWPVMALTGGAHQMSYQMQIPSRTSGTSSRYVFSLTVHCIAWEKLICLLQECLRRELEPQCKDQLVNGIMHFWETVNIGKCCKYIRHHQQNFDRNCSSAEFIHVQPCQV